MTSRPKIFRHIAQYYYASTVTKCKEEEDSGFPEKLPVSLLEDDLQPTARKKLAMTKFRTAMTAVIAVTRLTSSARVAPEVPTVNKEELRQGSKDSPEAVPVDVPTADWIKNQGLEVQFRFCLGWEILQYKSQDSSDDVDEEERWRTKMRTTQKKVLSHVERMEHAASNNVCACALFACACTL